MTTGERMKARRKEIGLSAEKVAEQLGVSPATVYRYEKGDIEKLPGKILTPLAAILKTTPAYLMGWDAEPSDAAAQPPSAQEITFDDFTYALHNELGALTDENKAKLLEMAKFFKQQQDLQNNE